MKTILFFISPPFTPNEGGVQRSTAKLSSVFKDKGFNCLIVSLSHGKNDEWEGIPIFYLQNMSTRIAKYNFENILKNYKVDVVINQMGSELDVTRFIVEVKSDSTKLINTLRMNPLSFVQNHRHVIKDMLKSRNLIFIDNVLLHKMILFYHRTKQNKVLSYILDKVDFYITLSPSFIHELEYFGINTHKYKDKLLAIPNMFPPVEVVDESKQNVVLYVGRIERLQKRIDLLSDIFKRLHSELLNWEFWVVGDGSDRIEFEDFCEINKLNRVRFFGYQNPNSFYKSAKILAFTSANEGFGNVLIEAQQYGVVPVMFNSYSGAPDIVKNEFTGVLVEPFDVDVFTNEILNLAQNDDLLDFYSRNAKVHSSNFEYESISERWFQTLRKC